MYICPECYSLNPLFLSFGELVVCHWCSSILSIRDGYLFSMESNLKEVYATRPDVLLLSFRVAATRGQQGPSA